MTHENQAKDWRMTAIARGDTNDEMRRFPTTKMTTLVNPLD
jgi:hypothetical protein